jgi:hypothetical protein
LQCGAPTLVRDGQSRFLSWDDGFFRRYAARHRAVAAHAAPFRTRSYSVAIACHRLTRLRSASSNLPNLVRHVGLGRARRPRNRRPRRRLDFSVEHSGSRDSERRKSSNAQTLTVEILRRLARGHGVGATHGRSISRLRPCRAAGTPMQRVSRSYGAPTYEVHKKPDANFPGGG